MTPRRPTRYTEIVAQLRGEIETGVLRPGDPVPSTRQITRRWGVAMATATKALTALREEGWVRAVPGVGTVVATGAVAVHPRDLVESGPPAPLTPLTPITGEDPPEEGRHTVTRDRRPSRDLVVAAAVGLADGEGLRSVSMRRIAARLDTSPMSLYRHVQDRDELLARMVDAVLVDVLTDATPDPEPAAGADPVGGADPLVGESWQSGLYALGTALWHTHRRHPWLAQVLTLAPPAAPPSAGPRARRIVERAAGLLARSGLPAEEQQDVWAALTALVRGLALDLAGPASPPAATLDRRVDRGLRTLLRGLPGPGQPSQHSASSR